MKPNIFTPAVKEHYQELWDNAKLTDAAKQLIPNIAAKMLANKERYCTVANSVGGHIPWFFIAALHNLEASMRFDKHLHNGDPLSARTIQVPAGRPAHGAPPYTWEESAADALTLHHLDLVTDWSILPMLWHAELYNGLGYFVYHHDTNSPYLWSMTDQYDHGKYVADGKWDASAVSRQCGVAAVLIWLWQEDKIHIEGIAEDGISV